MTRPSTTASNSRHSRRAGWLAVLLLVLRGPCGATSETNQPPKGASASSAPAIRALAQSPWSQIVLIGASASAGFTESEPLGGPITPQYGLSCYLESALLVVHEPVQNLANAMFFIQPEAAGRYQIDQALQAKPTLLVGIDFLFWFCYGEGPTDKERLQRFERGLKLLESVPCLLVLGDIPDASGASNDILPADQIPSVETMSSANRRLKEWAATHKNVVLVSLSAFMRTAVANQALTIHGHTVPEGKTRALLQNDRLHPSGFGSAILALAILDAIQSKRPTRPAAEIRWTPEEVFRLGFNASQQPQNAPAKQESPVPAGNSVSPREH